MGARKLVDILRALPADQVVTLTAQGARLALQAGRGRFTLHALPPEQFPLVAPAPDLGPALQLPQALLRRLITQVEFAMAVHDIRYYLNGVLLVIEGDVLRLVATDGNRLALAEAHAAGRAAGAAGDPAAQGGARVAAPAERCRA